MSIRELLYKNFPGLEESQAEAAKTEKVEEIIQTPAPSNEMVIVPIQLVGRCSNGNERGGKRVVHAVMLDANYDKQRRDIASYAICGATYGRHSAGFRTCDEGTEVTCPKCLKKLARKDSK